MIDSASVARRGIPGNPTCGLASIAMGDNLLLNAGCDDNGAGEDDLTSVVDRSRNFSGRKLFDVKGRHCGRRLPRLWATR